MIRRSTWIIFIIFLAILGGGLYFQKYKSEKNAQVTPTSTYGLLFTGFDQTQISGFEIDSSQGKKFLVTMEETGNWVVAGFPAEYTNTSSIDDMLAKIMALTVMSNLDTAPALEVIGLATPAYKFIVTLKDGQKKTAYIGKVTPTSSGYYGQLENGNPVVVGKYAVDNLINFLDKPPIATPVPTVTETSTVEMTQTPQP